MDLNKHIDRLVNIISSVPVGGRVSLLTGSNGSGKSLIRKQLPFHIGRQTGKEPGKAVASTSMELRTGSNPEWGALSSIMRDFELNPTSLETFHQIENILGVKDRYIVIDEPEIGMGEELVMSLVDYLNERIPKMDKSVCGIMVITHNRYIVENLNHDHFMNTDGLKTKQAWLDRKLEPVDLEKFKKNDLFYAIRDRQNAAEKNS